MNLNHLLPPTTWLHVAHSHSRAEPGGRPETTFLADPDLAHQVLYIASGSYARAVDELGDRALIALAGPARSHGHATRMAEELDQMRHAMRTRVSHRVPGDMIAGGFLFVAHRGLLRALRDADGELAESECRSLVEHLGLRRQTVWIHARELAVYVSGRDGHPYTRSLDETRQALESRW